MTLKELIARLNKLESASDFDVKIVAPNADAYDIEAVQLSLAEKEIWLHVEDD